MQSVSRNLGDNYQPDRPQNDYQQRFVYRVRCQAVRMENSSSSVSSRSSCSLCCITCRLKTSLLHVALAFVVQFCWVDLCIAQERAGIEAILRGDLCKLNVALQCFRDPISNFSGVSDLQFVFVNSYYRVTNLTRDNCTEPDGVTTGDPQVLIDLKGFVGRLVEGNESAFQFDRVTGTWWA